MALIAAAIVTFLSPEQLWRIDNVGMESRQKRCRSCVSGGQTRFPRFTGVGCNRRNLRDLEFISRDLISMNIHLSITTEKNGTRHEFLLCDI